MLKTTKNKARTHFNHSASATLKLLNKIHIRCTWFAVTPIKSPAWVHYLLDFLSPPQMFKPQLSWFQPPLTSGAKQWMRTSITASQRMSWPRLVPTQAPPVRQLAPRHLRLLDRALFKHSPQSTTPSATGPAAETASTHRAMHPPDTPVHLCRSACLWWIIIITLMFAGREKRKKGLFRPGEQAGNCEDIY